MSILGYLILFGWLLILPIFVGSIFATKSSCNNNSIVYRFLSGNMLLWAGFQLICVPCIVLEKSVVTVVYGYLAAAAILLLAGILTWRRYPISFCKRDILGKGEIGAWAVFGVLLAIQLICAVVLTYADGDDAFYVAVSEIADDSDTMYQKSPYTVGMAELDIRHGLAPFPIWITFLARISGMHTALVAHVVAAAYLILMSYGAFYLVGKALFEEKRERIPLFMIFMSFLVLFGDYSSRTPENFMIARSRQGKAAVGSIIIPMLIFLLFSILKRVQQNQKLDWQKWGLLTATITAACLCTTLGTFLSCAMVGCVGCCCLLVYKKWRPVLQMALCCVPAVCFALLYFVLG